jgi:adenylate kinase family enzyme
VQLRALKIKRSDDLITEQRYQVYLKETLPIVEKFREMGLLTNIDASASLEEVCREAEPLLRRHFSL